MHLVKFICVYFTCVVRYKHSQQKSSFAPENHYNYYTIGILVFDELSATKESYNEANKSELRQTQDTVKYYFEVTWKNSATLQLVHVDYSVDPPLSITVYKIVVNC